MPKNSATPPRKQATPRVAARQARAETQPKVGSALPVTLHPQHIRAAQAVYFASLFEYLTAFKVVDLLIQAYKKGKLRALDPQTLMLLQHYAEQAKSRLSEAARRDLYTQALGIPGGGDGIVPNHEFAQLWLRFIKTVAAYAKQVRSELAHHKALDLLEVDAIRAAAQALAANLSAHGGGETYTAAAELHKQVTELATILSEPKLQQAYGVVDMWQLMERVAHLEWGQGADSVRYRTMASCAGVIMAWLAKNASRLGHSASKLERPNLHVHPTDAELILECQRWLEVQKAGAGRKSAKPKK